MKQLPRYLFHLRHLLPKMSRAALRMIGVSADASKLIAALDRLTDLMDKEVGGALEAALDRAVVIAKAGDFRDGTGSEHLRDMIRYSLEGKFSDDTLIGTFGAYASTPPMWRTAPAA